MYWWAANSFMKILKSIIKKGNRAKQNRMRGGEARVERHSRSGRTRLLACREADAGSWRNSLVSDFGNRF